MAAYNHVVVMGTVTRDPVIKSVGPAGTKLVILSLCINEKRKTTDGKMVDNPVFVDVDVWTKLADLCERLVKKHSIILVDGALQMAQWEKDGVKHQKIKIRARSIKFLSKPDRSAKSGQWNKPRQEAPAPQAPATEEEVYIPDEADAEPQEENFDAAFSKW